MCLVLKFLEFDVKVWSRNPLEYLGSLKLLENLSLWVFSKILKWGLLPKSSKKYPSSWVPFLWLLSVIAELSKLKVTRFFCFGINLSSTYLSSWTLREERLNKQLVESSSKNSVALELFEFAFKSETSWLISLTKEGRPLAEELRGGW